jgi:hypothetical protein
MTLTGGKGRAAALLAGPARKRRKLNEISGGPSEIISSDDFNKLKEENSKKDKLISELRASTELLRVELLKKGKS